MRNSFFLIVLCLQGFFATAQFNRFSIRQSFESDDAKENPAIFSLTFPKDTSSSYLIDLAVSYRLSSQAKQSYGSLVAEYHRTNLIDEEVNNFQIGYKHKWTLKKPNVVGGSWAAILASLNQPFKSVILNSSGKFRVDDIEKSKGIAASFLLSYFKLGSGNNSIGIWNFSQPRPGKAINLNNRFSWMFLPELGMEFQHNFKEENTIVDGFVGRGVAKANISFGTTRPNPNSAFIPYFKWLFTADLAARYDLFGEDYSDSKFHPLIKTSLDFYLVNDKPLNLILGGSFTYGDNPIEGFREFKFEPQQVWMVALKVKK